MDETLHTALAVLRASSRALWLHTGDLGRIDPTGAVTVVDRLKELIDVDGFQVAPAKLEALLIEHPDVADAGVVGCPDERHGQVPVAFVVPARQIYEAALPPGWPSGSRRTSGRGGSSPSTGCHGRRPASCSAASCSDPRSESLPTHSLR